MSPPTAAAGCGEESWGVTDVNNVVCEAIILWLLLLILFDFCLSWRAPYATPLLDLNEPLANSANSWYVEPSSHTTRTFPPPTVPRLIFAHQKLAKGKAEPEMDAELLNTETVLAVATSV